MFEDIFKKFHDKNSEIKLIGVWGKDGLELEKQNFSPADEFDTELTGAEMADIISKIEMIKLTPENYFIKLSFRGYYLIIFSLTPDFFLMLLTDKTIIQGKLNFYLSLYQKGLLTLL